MMLAEWFTAFGTILLAIVAAFQDQIRSYLSKPKLDLTINLSPPDCHKTNLVRSTGPGTQEVAECYYIRLRVRNLGNYRAEYVEAQAAELHRELENRELQKVETFLPMNLVWSHVRTAYLPSLSPGMEKLLDLGHIIDPARRAAFPSEENLALNVPPGQPTLALDTEVISTTPGHILAPGVYFLKLVLGASNSKPLVKSLRIRLIGTWHPDTYIMFGGCVLVEVQ